MEFPSNSQNIGKKAAAPKERPAVEQVTTGKVVARPKSIGSRFRGIFFSGDFRASRDYIISDVMLPALRNMAVDSSAKFFEKLIYGDRMDGRRRPQTSYSYTAPRTNYGRPTSYQASRGVNLPDQPPYRQSSQPQRRKEAGEIILVSREEAVNVLGRLGDIVDKYEMATLADLYDLVGLPSTYIDNKWGWYSIANSDIRQIREGYLLELPPVEPIES